MKFGPDLPKEITNRKDLRNMMINSKINSMMIILLILIFFDEK